MRYEVHQILSRKRDAPFYLVRKWGHSEFLGAQAWIKRQEIQNAPVTSPDLIFFAITAYVVLMFGFMVADVIVGGHKRH